MLLDALTTQGLHASNRRGQAERARDVRRTGTKLSCAVLECLSFDVDLASHVGSRLIRRHFFENFSTCPQHAYTHRTHHLVAGEGKKVTTDRLHIECNVRCRLGRVDEHARTGPSRPDAYLSRRIDVAGDVRHMAERHELRALR